MSEKPILFSGPMVRAILEGRKTQTRRIMKPQPVQGFHMNMPKDMWTWHCKRHDDRIAIHSGDRPGYFAPWMPGDTLWVRETWCHKNDDGRPAYNSEGNLDSSCVYYCADGVEVLKADGDGFVEFRKDGIAASPWKPSIHMPRWASRITLEVKAVRVERLQDIGMDGRKAKEVSAEGLPPESYKHLLQWFHADDAPAIAFGQVWDSINGAGAWDQNPWVWVIEFEVKK